MLPKRNLDIRKFQDHHLFPEDQRLLELAVKVTSLAVEAIDSR